jgi:hypothetical protein
VSYVDGTDAVGGEPVEVTGFDGDHVEVELTSTQGNDDAVVADPATNGNHPEAVFHGFVWVQVDDPNLSGGEQVSSDTTGAFSDAAGDDYRVCSTTITDPESGEDIALIRYE